MQTHPSSLRRQPWPMRVQRSTSQQRHWLRIVVVGMMVGITALHYLTSVHVLPYHSIYRSLYYLPVGMAAVLWGVRGGCLTALITALVYLPHALFLPMSMPNKVLDNSLEMATLLLVAGLTGVLADAERHHRNQADALRLYINDVLTSLPVGVATVEGSIFKPQNPAAQTLVPNPETIANLPTTLGYHELVIGTRPLAIHRSPLHGRDGVPIGQVVVLEDMSEQRRLAEHVRRAERMAALGHLAGGLAHEVRNPLGIIRATTQLLQRKLHERPDLHDHTRILTTESDRIDRLIWALLKYASPRPLDRRPVDLAAVFRDLAVACTPIAHEQHVSLAVTLEPARIIVADRDYLWQAMLNIILNAIQASGPGQTVQMGFTTHDHAVMIAIRDHGCGIPVQHRERVFDPFFTTRDEGTGMGLAVVARIVAEHGGTVSLTSPPDGGTCVPVQLPLTMEVVR